MELMLMPEMRWEAMLYHFLFAKAKCKITVEHAYFNHYSVTCQASKGDNHLAQTSSSAKSTSSPAAFIGHDFFAHCIYLEEEKTN